MPGFDARQVSEGEAHFDWYDTALQALAECYINFNI